MLCTTWFLNLQHLKHCSEAYHGHAGHVLLFLGAIKQYLCLSLSKNSASSLLIVFQHSCSIFISLVIEAQVDMPIVGAIALHVSLLTFTLRVHPDRLDYVDQVLVYYL
ncbi:hypothetical protein RIF29_10953 [Crotalaria pallida]|uniref:Uncharacterized protein n=1 Tax=Crotalaria pallida TaxID=3830 RepID=A0AAN9IK95_CROPI